ncbi:MAG: secondary thiamine-phosphate synthase enzyme YjbQ [Pseudomonadota bacterium]
MHNTFEVDTSGPGMIDITAPVARWLRGAGDGAVVLMIQHTSASLLIQENADPDVQTDMLAWLARIAPSADNPSMSYLRHRAEGPDDMPAHLRAAVLPTSLHIPVAEGRMRLGTWQGIYVIEHRTRPHRRRVVATFVGA